MLKRLLLSLLFAGLLCACEDDTECPAPEMEEENPVTSVLVPANLSESTTWYGDSIYEVKNSVTLDADLTIEPGAVIKFHPETGMELTADAVITALGTQSEPIVFTSIYDPDHAGQVVDEEVGTLPDRGDWLNIALAESTGAVFSYCAFYYGGNTTQIGVLNLGTGNHTVHKCIFGHNNALVTGGKYNGTLYADDAGVSTRIEGCAFYYNTVPLSIDAHISIDNSNVFHNPESELMENDFNGIFVYGEEIIRSSATWEETEVPYVIAYETLTIWEGVRLTLGDDVALKFLADAGITIRQQWGLENYDGSGVVFTSFKHDGIKGDTNGDGSASSPEEGDWFGIYDNYFGMFLDEENVYYAAN